MTRVKRPRFAIRVTRRGVRLVLSLVTVGVLAVPFLVAWRLYQNQLNVTRQEDTAAARVDTATQARWQALTAGLPKRAAPVVLTYHDVAPGSPSKYVVGPDTFERQLAALKTAGYRTLTVDEFVAYLLGGPVPERSVLLTFDDGTHGLWTYADRILARHGMHAVSFLITGSVSVRRPYYLSWQEIARMDHSGRWDFQDHTHDLHSRTRTGPGGQTGSLLTNRRYLASTGTQESQARYERRVREDFRRSLESFEDHGLPRPRLFAYPFSENARPGAHSSSYVHDLVNRLFAAALSDKTRSPEPAGRRSTIAQQYQRLEVFADTTADSLLRQITTRTPVPATGDPLSAPQRWTGDNWKPLTGDDLGFLTGKGPYPRTEPYKFAAYAPYGSADWDHYTVDTDAQELDPGGGSVSVFARVGSPAQIAARVSYGTVQLVGGPGGKKVLAERELMPAAAHSVRLHADGARTTVVVDGAVSLTAGHTEGAGGTGGTALAVSRQGARDWPRVGAVHLARSAVAAQPPVTVAGARPFDGAGPWVTSGPRGKGWERTDVVTGGGRVQPVGVRGWLYAAYDPTRTRSWTDYTLRTTVTGLAEDGVHGNLTARRGAPEQVTVRVSKGWLSILTGPDATARQVLARKLPESGVKTVTITVRPDITLVKVGTTVSLEIPARGGRGGIALSAYRQSPLQPWPAFEAASLRGAP
ncbi:polysaccharide deacetylase family protein [Streptomyces sp. NPDC050095]|uniref:polysaccharide deacetylase family protein n=1 Tax=unclassified Streptomyces TaxID=2593676 RepID=UPI003433F9CB